MIYSRHKDIYTHLKSWELFLSSFREFLASLKSVYSEIQSALYSKICVFSGSKCILVFAHRAVSESSLSDLPAPPSVFMFLSRTQKHPEQVRLDSLHADVGVLFALHIVQACVPLFTQQKQSNADLWGAGKVHTDPGLSHEVLFNKMNQEFLVLGTPLQSI